MVYERGGPLYMRVPLLAQSAMGLFSYYDATLRHVFDMIEDRGMGALLGALERRQAGEIVILQPVGCPCGCLDFSFGNQAADQRSKFK